MADLSKITLPDNTKLNIKDATARSSLATKQDTLVSGTNIKTINNESLLGSGNITIGGGSSLPDPTGHEGDVLAVNSQESLYWMDTSSVSGIDLVTSISSSSTDSMVPSAKAVYDAIEDIDALPSQTGNSGKFLTTNGANASWANVPEEVFVATYNSTSFSDIATAYNAGKTIICKNSSGNYCLLYRADNSRFDFALPSTTGFSWYYVDSTHWWTAGSTFVPSTRTVNSKALSSNITLDASDVGALPDSTVIPSPADATPLMDGSTGAVGTSTDYAREDHKHPSDTNKQDKITASGLLKGDGNGGVTAATGGTDYARMSDVPTVPSNIVNTITTTAGAHTAITSQKGNVSFNVPTTASHVGAIAAPSSPSLGNVLTYNGSSWVAQAPASGLPTQDATTNGKYLISNGTSGAAWNTITASSIGAQPSGTYKTTQSAKTDPIASGATTAFIDSITQNANGEITATKKNIDTQLVTEIVIEGTPSSGSSNLVTSGGIYSALSAKQDSLPSITGNNGKYLTTNGLTLSWGAVDALPGQAGNAGKYLTTNGTTASWEAAEGATVVSFDSTPQQNSTNLITSGAIYTALQNAGDVFICDTDETTFNEALTAYDAGKTLIAVIYANGGGYYYPLVRATSTIFRFARAAISTTMPKVTYSGYELSSSGWSLISDELNVLNRQSLIDAADTNYTTLMGRGEKLLDATTYDAVSNWSSQLVNGAIAWRYE